VGYAVMACWHVKAEHSTRTPQIFAYCFLQRAPSSQETSWGNGESSGRDRQDLGGSAAILAPHLLHALQITTSSACSGMPTPAWPLGSLAGHHMTRSFLNLARPAVSTTVQLPSPHVKKKDANDGERDKKVLATAPPGTPDTKHVAGAECVEQVRRMRGQFRV